MTALLAGRYRLVEALGAGATVWRARDEVLHRDVTVRALSRTEAAGAAAAARLRHPSVAAVHDVFTVEGQPWIVAELPDGPTLQRVVGERGPLPPAEVAALGAALLEALAAGHALGAQHGAVQPGHVVLASSGRWTLTGFATGGADPGFAAPEARTSHAVPLPASDLWSLAATLLTAATGRPPTPHPPLSPAASTPDGNGVAEGDGIAGGSGGDAGPHGGAGRTGPDGGALGENRVQAQSPDGAATPGGAPASGEGALPDLAATTRVRRPSPAHEEPGGTLRFDLPGGSGARGDQGAGDVHDELRRLLLDMLAEDPARRPDAWTARSALLKLSGAPAGRGTHRTPRDLATGGGALEVRPPVLAVAAAGLALVVAVAAAGVTTALVPGGNTAVAAASTTTPTADRPATTPAPSSATTAPAAATPTATIGTAPTATGSATVGTDATPTTSSTTTGTGATPTSGMPSGDGTPMPERSVAAHTPPATPDIPPGDDTGKAISTVPDLCETLTDEQVAQLVLNPQKPQSYLAGSCSWSSDISIDVPDRLTMDLRVQVKLSPDAAEAAKTFGFSREMAARMSTSSYSEMVNWPPRPITGLGNEAYATDSGHRSILGPSFTANVTFRVSNAIVEVEYGRDVAEDSRMRERAVQAARWIGQAIAHGD